MNTNGLRRFSRVITTKRPGTCNFCEKATVEGTDFAAVNAKGTWIAVCATCATSLSEQVKGVLTTLGQTEATPELLALKPSNEDMLAAIDGKADEKLSFTVLVALKKIRVLVRAANDPLKPLIDALRTVGADANASPRDREFALSIVSQHERGRTLSEKQLYVAQRIAGQAAPEAPATPANGLYVNTVNGRIYKVYTTKNDRPGCKILTIHTHGDHHTGTFEWLPKGTMRVADLLKAGEARIMTQDEASAFGQQYSFCCNCALDLSDDRSIAAGYGPTCAANNGWFYPSWDEAAAILKRPVTMPNGKVVNPA